MLTAKNLREQVKLNLIAATAAFLVISIVAQNDLVRAGGPVTAGDCYNLGYGQGQDKPFQRGNYDSCERFRDEYNNGNNPYYEGFIDGCKSVEGNTEEICQNATD